MMPSGFTSCLQMLATSNTLYLCPLYVLTMLYFLHNYCCTGPINRQGGCKLKLYNFFITPVKTEMCTCCLGAKTHVEGGLSQASVGGLPASTSAESFHAIAFLRDL